MPHILLPWNIADLLSFPGSIWSQGAVGGRAVLALDRTRRQRKLIFRALAIVITISQRDQVTS